MKSTLEIVHHFRIAAPAQKITEAILSKEGLNAWWTEDAEVEPHLDGKYVFYFAEHSIQWEAQLSKYSPGKMIEWTFTKADEDWTGTKVLFELKDSGDLFHIHFSHTGWKAANEHMYITNYCWALYLRLLKRYVERGEIVPYSERSDY